jgi:leucyl aminopeptidase
MANSAQAPFALAALPAGAARRASTSSAAMPAWQLLPEAAAMSWELGSYQLRSLQAGASAPPATLQLASRQMTPSAASPSPRRSAATRDLVNTPAEHMGPDELAAAAQGPWPCSTAPPTPQTVGDALAEEANFPSHSRGRPCRARARRG